MLAARIAPRLGSLSVPSSPWLAVCLSVSAAGVTLKCIPHEKSAREKIITIWYVFSSLKYRRPIKSPQNRMPPEKSPPADNLRVKICFARAAAERADFLPVNFRPEETFMREGGDLIMGHRLTAGVELHCSLLERLDGRVVTREHRAYRSAQRVELADTANRTAATGPSVH